jgi:hypothetical protein
MKRQACFWGTVVYLLLSVMPAISDDQANSIINCDIQKGPCIQLVADHKVSLDILPKPVTAMQDLTFRVAVDGPVNIADKPFIDLNMPAMNMGPNRVQLEDLGGGVLEGSGVIVRCKSGRRTWQAVITIPGLGEAKFIFNVIY